MSAVEQTAALTWNRRRKPLTCGATDGTDKSPCTGSTACASAPISRSHTETLTRAYGDGICHLSVPSVPTGVFSQVRGWNRQLNLRLFHSPSVCSSTACLFHDQMSD